MDTSFEGYFVYRDDSDPTTLHFFPPKDSDDLFDALRAKFPLVKSHSERMRDAIIDFLMEERQADLIASTTSTSPVMPSDVASASPWQQSWPSMSTTSSSFNSPDTLDIPTPAYLESPKPQASNSLPSTDQVPPQLEQMTGVFSLTSTTQPKQRVRRKMTEAEKVEYRKRRIVKACDKCQKRKRKCHHNQPEMETVSTKPGKVSKPRAASRAVKSEIVDLLSQDNTLDFDAPLGSDMQLFDDFTHILDDDLFRMPVNATANVDLQPVDSAWLDHMWYFQQDASILRPSQSSTFGEPQRELPVPTHTAHTHDTEGSLAYVYDAPEGLGIGISPPSNPSREWSRYMELHAAAQQALNALTMPRSSVRLQPAALGQTPLTLPAADVPSTALTREEWAIARDGCSYRSSAAGDASRNSAWDCQHLACQTRSRLQDVDQPDTSPSNARNIDKGETHGEVVNYGADIEKASKSENANIAFGSGIDRAKSPSAELFMLRRRGIPPQIRYGVSSRIPRSQGIVAPAAALGSVLQTISPTTSPRSDDETAQRNPVVHTRGRNPSASPSSSPGDTDQRLFSDGEPAQRNPVVHTRNRNPSASANASPGDTDQRLVNAPGSSEERLTCHNRFRDHHGRVSTVLQVIPLATAALLVAAILPQAIWLAFLAMCVPISGGVAQSNGPKQLPLLSSLSRLVHSVC